MRDTPSRKSAHATATICPKTQAVGTVRTRKVSPGKCDPRLPSVVTPVAGDSAGWKLSPPSVDTIILIWLPLIHTMEILPLAATLISGEKESLTRTVPAGVTPEPAPTHVAPWSLVRAKRMFDPSSHTA